MDHKDPKAMFYTALSLLRGGQQEEAESLCRDWLLLEHRNINFLSLLATILIRKNQFEEAEKHLKVVTDISPGYPNAFEDLGTVVLNLGRREEALIYLQKAIKLNPKAASAFFKLGGALKSLGRHEAGDAALKHASELSPLQAKLDNATRLFAEGKFRESEKLAKEVLSEKPRDVNAALLLARIALNARAYADAEQLLRKILEIAPRFTVAWHELGVALKEQGKEMEAALALESSLEHDPNNPTSHYYYAAALAMAGKTEEARDSYQQAVTLDPNQVGAFLGLGHVLKTLGDQDGGIAAYRRAIELKPNFGEVYFSLSNLKTFRFSDSEISEMVKRIEDTSLLPESVVHFAFTLGKALEDRGEYDNAFDYYARGNEEYRKMISYDPVQTAVSHKKIKETFQTDFFDRVLESGTGAKDASPIFIVGLPRSGSTLLEQILASHSLVDGTSELPDLGIVSQMVTDKKKGRYFPSGLLEMSDDELTGLGKHYLERVDQHRRGAPFFTDKMPNNFAHIGLLQAILPRARIIDARRHPLDSCVGCFKQHFAAGQTFTYDMFELGEFYLEYDGLMSHWNDHLPGKILRVQYEDVVSDLKSQVKRILDFCELPFEDSCLNFHQTKRSVRTASSEQVRQPIYKGSMNTWQRFDKQIEPLKEILDSLLDSKDPTRIVR